MGWAKYGIRVNALCPGHIFTPMVREHLSKYPENQELWERESMLGRISTPEEFRGPAVYLLSNASLFQTVSQLLVDGGHTEW